MFKKILVVCVGNICRSPLVEKILQAELGKEFDVYSAGLHAVTGNSIDPGSRKILDKLKIDSQDHFAKQLDHKIIQESDLILVMEKKHIQAITHISPESRGKVQLVGKWCHNQEIPDPFRRSQEYFHEIYCLIRPCVDSWAKVLNK